MRVRLLVVVCAATLVTAGCQTTNKDLSTVGGAVVGGVIGSQFGSGSGRLIATAGGAVVGAMVGRELGRYLDERDRQQLENATATTAATGEAETWENPDSGVSGRTKVVKKEAREEQVAVPVLKDRVEQVPPLELIGETYRATSNLNVRGGPGTDYKRVGSLQQDQAVQVAGKVKGEPWYMISEEGIGSGFTHTDFMVPAPAEAQVAEPAPSADRPDVATASVSASRECRTVEQVVTLADGSEQTDEVTACRGPNGWEVQA